MIFRKRTSGLLIWDTQRRRAEKLGRSQVRRKPKIQELIGLLLSQNPPGHYITQPKHTQLFCHIIDLHIVALRNHLVYNFTKMWGIGDCKTHQDFYFRAIFVSVLVFNVKIGWQILDLIWFCALFSLSISVQSINPPIATRSPIIPVVFLCVWVCVCQRHVCIHAKRYAWARERRGHCAAEDKCLFNWSWGQTAPTLWHDNSLFPCSDSGWLNKVISPVLAFITYLNYMWLTRMGPLWTVHSGLMRGIVRKGWVQLLIITEGGNNILVSMCVNVYACKK